MGYYHVVQLCSANCLGQGHGYACHSQGSSCADCPGDVGSPVCVDAIRCICIWASWSMLMRNGSAARTVGRSQILFRRAIITDYMWVALPVKRYLSNTASFVLCALRSVKDHHNLQQLFPSLKNTCVRQAALDKWLPLVEVYAHAWTRTATCGDMACCYPRR